MSSTQGAFGGVGYFAQGHLSRVLKVSSEVLPALGLELGTLCFSVPPLPVIVLSLQQDYFFLSNQCCWQSSNSRNLHFLIIKPETLFLNHQSWDSAVSRSQNWNRNHNIDAKQTLMQNKHHTSASKAGVTLHLYSDMEEMHLIQKCEHLPENLWVLMGPG